MKDLGECLEAMKKRRVDEEDLLDAKMETIKFKYLSNQLKLELEKRGMPKEEIELLASDIEDEFAPKFGLAEWH